MSLHIEGRRLPKQYGYGEYYLQRAIDWLREHGYPDAEYEVLKGSYSVSDVAREHDL